MLRVRIYYIYQQNAKNMSNIKLSEITQKSGIKELTYDEAIEYVGGESLWYWVCYAIGSATRAAGKLAQKHGEIAMEAGGSPGALAYK
jgi:hypothetical protein